MILFPDLPPPEEQRAIARYLEWADKRIQRLIEARVKQVELLEEYKQAIIQQAVTGQIDVRTGEPYPDYKDSGVEWLGKVPEHWKTKRLKFLDLINLNQQIDLFMIEKTKNFLLHRQNISGRSKDLEVPLTRMGVEIPIAKGQRI